MRIHTSQCSCFFIILKRIAIPSFDALVSQLAECLWIVCLSSLHIILLDFFHRNRHNLSTVRTSLFKPIFNLTHLIGIITAVADVFAAA